MQKQISVMVYDCISANGMGDLHMCEGTIDIEAYILRCTEKYTAIKMMSFMGSPLLLDQSKASSHSACATTVWFRRLRVNVLDWLSCSPDLSTI